MVLLLFLVFFSWVKGKCKVYRSENPVNKEVQTEVDEAPLRRQAFEPRAVQPEMRDVMRVQ